MFNLRHLRGPADLELLQAVDVACAAELAESGTDSGTVPLIDADPQDWFLAEVAGQVVGYGHATLNWLEKDGTWVYLHLGRVKPDFRRRGIGTALLAALEERCRDKAKAAGHFEHLEIAANASETEADASAFLAQRGYFVAYTNLEMRLVLPESLPEVPALPAGYELRPVRPEHHLAIWQSIGNAYDARDAQNPRFGEVPRDEDYAWYFSKDPSLYFVAWRGQIVAGQVLAERRADGCGELYEVSVGVGHQRRGLARTLMLCALHELGRRGVREVWIGTRQENPSQAWRLYESLGFCTVAKEPRWRKRRD